MNKVISGVHHIALKCKDKAEFEKAVYFYNELLGMPVVRKWGVGESQGIMIDSGNSLMEIFCTGKTSDFTGTVNHFAFACSDVDTVVETVRKEGYRITKEPVDICIPSEIPYPARIAFVIGPVGEEIEFFCEK